MANESNLKPLNKRPKEERKKIASMGGKASGEARRQRKIFKETMEELLALDSVDSIGKKKLKELGLPETAGDNQTLLHIALYHKALSGDVNAYREIRNLVGESGADNSEEIANVEQVLVTIRRAAEDEADRAE